MDEEQIELMIEACLELLSSDDSRFSAWEQTFLEDIEGVNDFEYLTEKQIEKLTEIWEDKCR